MNFAAAALAVVLFGLGLNYLGVVEVFYKTISIMHRTIEVLGNSSLDDRQKEAGARSAAISMLISLVNIFLRSGLAMIIPTALLAAAIAIGAATVKSLETALLSWPMLALSLVQISVYVLFRR